MKDILGQTIKVGSKVLWASGRYAGFEFDQPKEVIRLTEHRIVLDSGYDWREKSEVFVEPSVCVVVDKLIGDCVPQTENKKN